MRRALPPAADAWAAALAASGAEASPHASSSNYKPLLPAGRRAAAIAATAAGLIGAWAPRRSYAEEQAAEPTATSVASSTAATDPVSEAVVVDATSLLAPSTRKSLQAAFEALQRDTGIRLRLVCPPPGLMRDKESFGEYIRPISKSWGIDQSSIVVMAEQRVQGKSGKSYSLLNFSPGFRLLERFQFRLTSDYFIRTRNRFGGPTYVDTKGPDAAVRDGTRNLIACLYKLTEDKAATCPDPLEPREVEAVLARHGL